MNQVQAEKILASMIAFIQQHGDEEVAASYAAESLEILFNSKYILDLQDVIEGDTIMLELLNQSSPVIVKDPKDTTSLYILMPMRI